MPKSRSEWRTVAIVVIALSLLVGGFFLRWEMPRVQLPAEPVAEVAGVTITNTLLATWLAMLVTLGLFWAATRRMTFVPGPLQNLAEMIVEGIMGLCVSVAGERNGRRFFTLVASIFIFILIANWMGLLPGFGTIGVYHEVAHEGQHELEFIPLLRGATTDLNTTVALALISVVATQVYGIRSLGLGTYLSKFFNIRGGVIGMAVGLLELISELARIVSFSFRLFGNIFAGEVLLTVIAFLLPLVVAIPFYGLEVFVGAVQAFIFAMLTLVFMTIAITSHDEHHEGASEHGH